MVIPEHVCVELAEDEAVDTSLHLVAGDVGQIVAKVRVGQRTTGLTFIQVRVKDGQTMARAAGRVLLEVALLSGELGGKERGGGPPAEKEDRGLMLVKRRNEASVVAARQDSLVRPLSPAAQDEIGRDLKNAIERFGVGGPSER